MSTASDPGRYVLGHTERELDRLDLQGALYRDVTRCAMIDAGIGEGTRVLDIGCGSGDVSFLAAELVGPHGFVLGIDREAITVEAARRRASDRGATHVEFRIANVRDRIEDRAFDALVGRFILMHQQDPAAVLAAAARNVRSGGAVVLIESCMAAIAAYHSFPHSPVYDTVVRWKCAVVGGSGADLEAGLRLRATFLGAGLPEPAMRFDARVEGGPDSPLYGYMAESVRSMLPQAHALGIEGFDESSVDTLADRLRADVLSRDGLLVNWPVVAAWTHVR
ncbi:MAG: class I SAM-dependent methyltransferase [Gemmatimonadetes bacterium]|nr:class I SAM-dependent methyltransferase [Gemmatimonadota bacterium]